MSKTVIVLIDIDYTLANFEESNDSKDSVVWMGGSPDEWIKEIKQLTNYAHGQGVKIYYGIATFKPLMDWIARDVITKFKDILDPNLIFYTNHQCKNIHALQAAKVFFALHDRYLINKDLWIIDDNPNVISAAKTEGYNAIHAINLDISCLFIPIKQYIYKRARQNEKPMPLTNVELGIRLYCYVENKQYSLAKDLLKKYPSTPTYYCYHDINDMPSHIALSQEKPDTDLIKLLSKNNRFLSFENNKNETVLHIAVQKEHFSLAYYFIYDYWYKFSNKQMGEIVLLLVQKKQFNLAITLLSLCFAANRDIQDHCKNTALHLLLQEKKIDFILNKLIKLLLRNNNYLSLTNNKNQAILQIAISTKQFGMVEHLLAYYSSKFTGPQLEHAFLHLTSLSQFKLAKLILRKSPSLSEPDEDDKKFVSRARDEEVWRQLFNSKSSTNSMNSRDSVKLFKKSSATEDKRSIGAAPEFMSACSLKKLFCPDSVS